MSSNTNSECNVKRRAGHLAPSLPRWAVWGRVTIAPTPFFRLGAPLGRAANHSAGHPSVFFHTHVITSDQLLAGELPATGW
jgi:hypothetical protein